MPFEELLRPRPVPGGGNGRAPILTHEGSEWSYTAGTQLVVQAQAVWPYTHTTAEFSPAGAELSTIASTAYEFAILPRPEAVNSVLALKWAEAPDRGTQWIGLSVMAPDLPRQFVWDWRQVDGTSLTLPAGKTWADYTLSNGRIYVCVVLTGPQAGAQTRSLNWIRLGSNIRPRISVSPEPHARFVAPAVVNLSASGYDEDGYVVSIEIRCEEASYYSAGSPDSIDSSSVFLTEPGHYTFTYSGFDDESGTDPVWPKTHRFVVVVAKAY